jgi:hypothetical protein
MALRGTRHPVSTWPKVTQGGFLGSLPPVEAERMIAAARRRRFQRGDIVFHEGDAGETLHLVSEGRFGVHTGTAEGDRVMLEMVSPGDVFGELSIFATDSHRTATVVALEPGETTSIMAQADDLRIWDAATGTLLNRVDTNGPPASVDSLRIRERPSSPPMPGEPSSTGACRVLRTTSSSHSRSRVSPGSSPPRSDGSTCTRRREGQRGGREHS